MVLLEPSPSDAEAVMPTTVPFVLFSAMELAAAFVSVTGPTSNSSTSVRLIEKTCVEKLLSLEVARTVMLWEVAASKLSSVEFATVTMPVPLAIAKRPPALSSSE